MKRNAEIVIARGWRYWSGAVPELAHYPFLSWLQNPRKASLSERNLKNWTRICQLFAD